MSRNGEAPFQQDWASGKKFIMALHKRDTLIIEKDGSERVCQVLKISDTDITLILHTDARSDKDRGKDYFVRARSYEVLQKLNARKITVDPIGRIRRAHD